MGKPELGIKFTRRLADLGLTYGDMPELARRLREAGFEFRNGSFADRAYGEARHHAIKRIAAGLVQERQNASYTGQLSMSSLAQEGPMGGQATALVTIQLTVSFDKIPALLNLLGAGAFKQGQGR